MKMRLALAAVPVALLSLSACSSMYDYGYGGYGYNDYGYDGYGYDGGYGYNDYRPGVNVGLVYHDAWYDNFYGPIYGGYWGSDGYFWYQNRIGGSYIGDYSRHFRRDQYRGYTHNRYQDNRGHDGRDRDRDRNTYPPLFKGQDRDRDNDRNGRDNTNGGRDWTNDGRNGAPRGNPSPPQGIGGRGNDDRNNGGADRGGNGRGNGGQQWGGNGNGNGNAGGPPAFGGQPRVNPTPAPRGGSLDGAPRGGRDDGGRTNDRGGNERSVAASRAPRRHRRLSRVQDPGPRHCGASLRRTMTVAMIAPMAAAMAVETTATKPRTPIAAVEETAGGIALAAAMAAATTRASVESTASGRTDALT